LREDAGAINAGTAGGLASAACVLGGTPFADRWFIWRSVEDMAADCLTMTRSRI
jgi:hypothetical protein